MEHYQTVHHDIAIPIWVMKDSSTFQCESFVRRYHIYINIWEPLVGECLKSRKETLNEMDKTAVAVTRINSYSEEVVVGHVSKNMFKTVFMLLSLPHCALAIFLTGKRINRGGGYGLEIPANVYFYDPKKAINWLKNEIYKIEEKFKENVKHSLK